jgi:signal transduction histidine kinase
MTTESAGAGTPRSETSTNENAMSGTLDRVHATAQGSERRGSFYGRLWRGVPRELGFLLLSLPIVVVGFGLLNGLFWPGVGTVIVYVGLFLVLAALYLARGFGTLELFRLRASGHGDITRPQWRSAEARRGFWRAAFGPYVNGHYWLYLAHGAIINPVVGIATWALTLGWVAGGLGGTTFWFWDRFDSHVGQDFHLSRVLFGAFFPDAAHPFDPVTGDRVLFFAFGLIFLATVPFVTRALTSVHAAIAHGFLAAWRSEALQREVADLSASRGAAIHAEDQSLRRLERDIHDGPQQRLVRLQMDISSAERKLDSDPDAARNLLAEANTQARDALEELRALSRGFAPPILQDRGLQAGLESLAARSTVPATFDSGISAQTRFTPEIERSAYFIAAELLTNVAKHSDASTVRLSVLSRRDPLTDQQWLDIWVSDNGRGGASVEHGHGLGGLDERLRGLRGSLHIDSPAGGPTQISAHLPVPPDDAVPAS